MQKKFNFLRVKKYTAVIGVLLVLMLSAVASDLIVTRHYTNETEIGTESYSMYKQLEIYPEEDKVNADATLKMNNYEFENANVITEDDISNSLTANDTKVKVLSSEKGTVAEMALDDYVLCSLVAEMPLSFDIQALKAQAVAIRTYTVRCILLGSKHKNADVCDDYRCCQSMIYPKDINFDISKAKKAVADTSGIIAVFDGKPILAAYHSSSVGSTKSSEQVWGGKLDYLVPVFAPEDKSVSQYTVRLQKKNVKTAFERNGLTGGFVFQSDDDGMCIGAKSEKGFLSAGQIMRILGLHSDVFTVSEDKEYYEFTTYGFGHGVGMSQYGADALAKDGYSFYEILKHFYTGTSFAFLE